MANKTAGEATTRHGTNPQYLIEKIIRSRIYESIFWKQNCFGLTAEDVADIGADCTFVGGVSTGLIKPSPFLCLTLKLLQIQPELDIIVEYITQPDFKYLSCLGALYLRLVGRSLECYKYLEPMLKDPRKIKFQDRNGAFSLSHVDEFVDMLLTEERVCDIILPRLTNRYTLELEEKLDPYDTSLLDDLEEEEENDDDEEETTGKAAKATTPDVDPKQEVQMSQTNKVSAPKENKDGNDDSRDRQRRSSRDRSPTQRRNSRSRSPRDRHRRDQARRRSRSRSPRRRDRDRRRRSKSRSPYRRGSRSRSPRSRRRRRRSRSRSPRRRSSSRSRSRSSSGSRSRSRSPPIRKEETSSKEAVKPLEATSSSSDNATGPRMKTYKLKLKGKSDGKKSKSKDKEKEKEKDKAEDGSGGKTEAQEIAEANALRAKLGLKPLK